MSLFAKAKVAHALATIRCNVSCSIAVEADAGGTTCKVLLREGLSGVLLDAEGVSLYCGSRSKSLSPELSPKRFDLSICASGQALGHGQLFNLCLQLWREGREEGISQRDAINSWNQW